MSEPRTVEQLLKIAERVLADSTHIFEEHDNAQEAEDLLRHCLETGKDDELDDGEEPDPRVRERFLSMVTRRAAGEPLPFLTGSIEFWGLDLQVRPGAFVPRPSSELTVEWALKRLKKKGEAVMVDVCTGSGPIALAVADELSQVEVWALDVSEEGLSQGRENAERLNIENVRFQRSDMYDDLPPHLEGKVHVITGHVPYVPHDELDDLPTEVREYEPADTLTDHSEGGLGLMTRAVYDAKRWLSKGGWLLLEMADDIAPDIEEMCREAGYDNVGIVADDDELSVVVEGRFKG